MKTEKEIQEMLKDFHEMFDFYDEKLKKYGPEHPVTIGLTPAAKHATIAIGILSLILEMEGPASDAVKELLESYRASKIKKPDHIPYNPPKNPGLN